jgi:hypothetical protein
MKIRLFVATSLLGLAAPLAQADTVVVGDKVAVLESQVEAPTRGMHRAAVEKRFGAPQTRHASVGKPSITRWDYANFSVYFEKDIVLHSVVHAAPAEAAQP